jgi:hypothetical protein
MERKSIKELIFEIKKRPALYITRKDIFCLNAYLNGWYHMSPESVVDIEVLNDFQEWIAKEYKIKTSHGWASIILFFSYDNCDALNNFFLEFDRFLATKKGASLSKR